MCDTTDKDIYCFGLYIYFVLHINDTLEENHNNSCASFPLIQTAVTIIFILNFLILICRRLEVSNTVYRAGQMKGPLWRFGGI